MDLPPVDLVDFLFKLLPGFLAAAAFHGLTPYPKRDVFDRLVAALIFTLLAQVGVAGLKSVLFWFGTHGLALGEWSQTTELAWASGIGLSIGVVWAHAINNGWTHQLLRRTGTTKRSSLPTQWFSAFSRYERYVILHYRDGRRLMGWPLEWPDEPEVGHFVLQRPAWVLDDGTKAPMHQIETFLASARDVEHIEFLRFNNDPCLEAMEQEIRSASKALEESRKDKKHE